MKNYFSGLQIMTKLWQADVRIGQGKVIIITVALMALFLNAPALAVDSQVGGRDLNTLPWEIIAEKFDEKKPFCVAKSKDGKSNNYALNPDALTITLPSNIKKPKPRTKVKLKLSVWQQSQYVDLPSLTVRFDPKGLTLGKNAIAKGFYNMSVVFKKNSVGKENECHAIFVANWKKDLFTWCRKNKEQIEISPDSQLIQASIAVSHFDNLMELTRASQVLSENILSALANALRAKADFEGGNCPDLVIGLNRIRLKRFEGAAIAEFVIHIPKDYSETNKWPLYIHIDPRRRGAGTYGQGDLMSPHLYHGGMLDMWWHTISHEDLRWKDYESLMKILTEKLNIDDDRIYLNGRCFSAIATMALAVKYPDQWAACIFSTGNSYKHLSGNTTNLSIIFGNNEAHTDENPMYNYFAVQCFNYFGCRNFIQIVSNNPSHGPGILKLQTIRIQNPCRVFYTIESLANPSSYWVQIDGREDENFIASIDAIVRGQSVLVKTKNVDAYTLNLKRAPLDRSRPVEIIENDEHLGSVTGPIFVRTNPKYKNAAYVKNKFLHGPVSDIFTEQYAVVWKGDEGVKSLAEQIAGSGPCFAESNLPDGLVNTHNILFVGRPDKSKLFAKIADKLPVTIQDGRLVANGQVYEGDFGTLFVYPNPLNRQKYLAVLSGSTDKVFNAIKWDKIKSKGDADVNIFKVSENNEIDWLISEKFNTVWDWHKSWDVSLATLSKTYPKWKWRQWMARILRKQLNADVMMLENPFVSEELPDASEFTLRDMSKSFRNDWVVKISLKGSDLREVLIASRDSDLVIDGVSFIKQPGNSDVIFIKELDSERHYTLAVPYNVPYKFVYDDKFKKVKNYRLEGQEFLVVLLRDYLKENANLDLDAELDGMRLNIF